MITDKKRILLSDIKQNPTENGCSGGYNKRQNYLRQEMNFLTENTLKPTEIVSDITNRNCVSYNR